MMRRGGSSVPRSRQHGPQLLVSVQFATSRKQAPHARRLREWATVGFRQADQLIHNRTAHVVLRIVDAAESRRLNRTWRGKDKPTNVLSFPAGDLVADGVRELGDIVICKSVVTSEARAQGKALAAHWAHMVVHGMLHLLGYDHVRPRDAARMERSEARILAMFDYPDPYVL
jgi:probable rRNA maturation factor